MLKDIGATPVAERMARDRNRISGGDVTAGIDSAELSPSRSNRSKPDRRAAAEQLMRIKAIHLGRA